MVGLARRVQRLAQRHNALFREQRQQLEEDLPGHQRVTHSGMPADHADTEPLRDRLQIVAFLARMHYDRQQQGVEHRLGEPNARGGLLQLEKAHVESGIVRDQHRVFAKMLELRQDLAYGRLACQSPRLDAVNAGGGLADRPPRIDELLEYFALEQPGVDDAHRADADDLVAG